MLSGHRIEPVKVELLVIDNNMISRIQESPNVIRIDTRNRRPDGLRSLMLRNEIYLAFYASHLTVLRPACLGCDSSAWMNFYRKTVSTIIALKRPSVSLIAYHRPDLTIALTQSNPQWLDKSVWKMRSLLKPALRRFGRPYLWSRIDPALAPQNSHDAAHQKLPSF